MWLNEAKNVVKLVMNAAKQPPPYLLAIPPLIHPHDPPSTHSHRFAGHTQQWLTHSHSAIFAIHSGGATTVEIMASIQHALSLGSKASGDLLMMVDKRK